MQFVDLPTDILAGILRYLSARELTILARTCRYNNIAVVEIGWALYLINHPRPSHSLSRIRRAWLPHVQARYDGLTDNAWSRADFIARPLSRPWPRRCQPLLASNTSSLIVAAGPDIHTYGFQALGQGTAPSIVSATLYYLSSGDSKAADITSMVSGGCDEEQIIYVGLHDGSLRRCSLGTFKFGGEQPERYKRPVESNCTFHCFPGADFVESLSLSGRTLLSLSSDGRVNLWSTPSLDSSVDQIELNSRSWSSHLCLDASTPFAAFGTSSSRPLRVHLFSESKLLPTSSVHPFVNTRMSEYHSAVYGFSRLPPGSPWGASPQVLITGWFDGQVRCYDLRSSSQMSTSGSALTDVPTLRPVISFKDPMQLEAIYSVSSGGGAASYIAAGTARHSVVSFWDIRSPTAGWSVHAPGNDTSPVYSVILESSRLFGATQSRPFVFDFGPDISANLYPPLPPGKVDGLRRKKGSGDVGYYVTKYDHSGGIISAREA